MKCGSLLILATTLALGCSGDEDAGVEEDAGRPDARADGGATRDGGTSDVSIDGSPADGFIDIFDVFPRIDGPLGDCVSCVRDRCGMQVNQCANSASCRAGLLCTILTCVTLAGDAGLNPSCVTGCFMGDLAAAFSAISSFSCVNTGCGTTCLPGVAGQGGVPDASRSDATGESGDTGSATDTGSAADTGESSDTAATDTGADD
jgi:hypothetical protein